MNYSRVKMDSKSIRYFIAELLIPEQFKSYETLQNKNTELSNQLKSVSDYSAIKNNLVSVQNELLDINKQLIESNNKIKELEINLKNQNKTPLELYLESNYREVSKFSYKGKRIIQGKEISVYPNELITPDSYRVLRFKKDRNFSQYDSLRDDYKYLGYAKEVDRLLVWTADKLVWKLDDEYCYPNETIVLAKDDCEGHAILMASLDNNIGLCYGMCGSTGHAFNVFLYNNELYCIETNSVSDFGDNARIFKYSGQTLYDIHWIMTKNHTYKINPNASDFGILDTEI